MLGCLFCDLSIVIYRVITDLFNTVHNFLCQAGKKMGIIHDQSTVAVVTGWKTGAGSTNTLRILTVDEQGNFINKYGSN